MTGYDLMQEFGSALNEFWSAKHSQIYPELKKLTEEGMIEYDVEISGNVLEKKVYTITEAGRQDFLDWLGRTEKIGETPKDVFRLRTFFLHDLPEEKRKTLLTDGLKQHQKRLQHLLNNQEKFEKIPDKEDAAFGDYLVLRGAIMREETTCHWIEECIEMMEN